MEQIVPCAGVVCEIITVLWESRLPREHGSCFRMRCRHHPSILPVAENLGHQSSQTSQPSVFPSEIHSCSAVNSTMVPWYHGSTGASCGGGSSQKELQLLSRQLNAEQLVKIMLPVLHYFFHHQLSLVWSWWLTKS